MGKPSNSVRLALLGVLGKSPVAPGTAATLIAGIPAAFVVGALPTLAAFSLTVVIVLLSFHIADRAEKELQRHDPHEIVIDELAGYLVTMISLQPTPKNLLLGFLAFRLFDIWKPWPVDILQSRLRGGVAVVMDDVAAGIYAMALVHVINILWP